MVVLARETYRKRYSKLYWQANIIALDKVPEIRIYPATPKRMGPDYLTAEMLWRYFVRPFSLWYSEIPG